jgi:hypothetical protein
VSGVNVLNAPTMEVHAQPLERWLGTMMQLHQVLAGGHLISSPTPIYGSIQSELAMGEGAAVSVSPALKKQLRAFKMVGGTLFELPDDQGGLITPRDKFEGIVLLRGRSVQDDKTRELTGLQVEAIRHDQAPGESPDKADPADGVIIPGNEIRLSTFRVVEHHFQPVRTTIG